MEVIGKINAKVYQCIAEDIVTDEVIITERQIEHIKERHPNDFERFHFYLKEIVENPEYKNSIITFMKIDEKEWDRLLRNKKILYKKE